MTAAEPDARLLLAAGRRILSREGADSGAFGFLAARHPDPGLVLVTPAGSPDAITPADVAEVALDTNADALPDTVSRAVGIAVAILARRPDVRAVVHTHSRAVAVHSTLRSPIAMYNEMSTLFHDEQVVADDDGDRSTAACERLAAALGPRRVLVLPGHGMVAAAPSIGDAVIDAVALEKSAAWDLAARSYGGAPILQRHVEQTKPLYDRYFRRNMWAANLRRLRRDEPALFAGAR